MVHIPWLTPKSDKPDKSEPADPKQPPITHYAAVLMTSASQLVLGQPYGSNGWSATTVTPIRRGQNEVLTAFSAVDTVWHLGGPAALSCGVPSLWHQDDGPVRVSWWTRDIGNAAIPAIDGYQAVALHRPYDLLSGSLLRANSVVPQIPLDLVQLFADTRPCGFRNR